MHGRITSPPTLAVLPRKSIAAIAIVIEVAMTDSLAKTASHDLLTRLGMKPRSLEAHFQGLVKAGILTAQRGPRGGYALKRPPDLITCGEILRANPGNRSLGTVEHPSHRAITSLLRQADEAYQAQLDAITIADLIAEIGSEAQGCPAGEDHALEAGDRSLS